MVWPSGICILATSAPAKINVRFLDASFLSLVETGDFVNSVLYPVTDRKDIINIHKQHFIILMSCISHCLSNPYISISFCRCVSKIPEYLCKFHVPWCTRTFQTIQSTHDNTNLSNILTTFETVFKPDLLMTFSIQVGILQASHRTRYQLHSMQW